MMDEQNDFFVTGKVIDYLNYKSYVDNKERCQSSIGSKAEVEAAFKEVAKSEKGKEHPRAGFSDSDRYGY